MDDPPGVIDAELTHLLDTLFQDPSPAQAVPTGTYKPAQAVPSGTREHNVLAVAGMLGTVPGMSEAGTGTTAEADSVDMAIKTGVNTVMDALTMEIDYEQQVKRVKKLSEEEYFMNLPEEDQLALAIQASMETFQDDGFMHQFDDMKF
jgi:enamine deaminase RidA (YjgF/YER057c/UK114 family)